jgi:hypothetical protein
VAKKQIAWDAELEKQEAAERGCPCREERPKEPKAGLKQGRSRYEKSQVKPKREQSTKSNDETEI